jgi:hypothetical protein
MELGSILLLLVVLVIICLFVAWPFARNWRLPVQRSQEVSTLLAERERTLNALMELDFDNGMEKIPADEYSAQRARLVQKGSDILRQLDELHTQPPSLAIDSPEPNADRQPTGPVSDDDLEGMLARRRAVRRQRTAGFCPKCGKPILQSDHFCPACGQILDSV